MIEPAPELAEGAQLFRHADSLRRYEQVHKDDKVKGAKPSPWNQAFPSETPGGLIGLLFHAASELALEKSPPWVARLAYEAATSLRSSVEIVAVLDRQTKRERHYDWLLAGPPGLVARRRTDTLIPGTYVVRCRWCGEEFYSNSLIPSTTRTRGSVAGRPPAALDLRPSLL